MRAILGVFLTTHRGKTLSQKRHKSEFYTENCIEGDFLARLKKVVRMHFVFWNGCMGVVPKLAYAPIHMHYNAHVTHVTLQNHSVTRKAYSHGGFTL